MRAYNLFLIKFIFLFLIGYTNSNAQMVPFSFIESFENDNPVTYWTSSPNLPKPIIKYKFDNKTFTDANRSLFIDANITGLPNNQKWYYYLKIPLDEKVNLDGNLSFSMDVKMDKEDAKYLQIGLNIEYYPTSSGIYTFEKISIFNQWTTINSLNLQYDTQGHAKKWIGKNIYNATLDDIGRRLNYIGIFLKGIGDKYIKFYIDNIRIEGVQTNPKEFIQNARDSWDKYILNTKKDINRTKKLRKNLPIMYMNKNRLSSIELERYILGKKYTKKIDSILNKIESKNRKYSYFKQKDMEELNNTISYYRDNYNSLTSKDNITLYKFPALNYYRLNGYNTPPLEEAKEYKLRMTGGEYKSIALLMKSNHSFATYTANPSDFIGNKMFFLKDNLDLYIAKIWYQAGLHNTHKTGKFLTQELLLKDETLVKVDFLKKINYLKIVENSSGKERYIDISNPKKVFPKTDSITFDDSKNLKPFQLNSIRHKLLWGIVHIPLNTPYGIYKSTIQIKNLQGEIKKEILVEVEVLPFLLDKSKLTYSLYYHGKLDDNAKPIHTYKKTEKQLEIELRDMKEHGVLYPTSYDSQIDKLDRMLTIRDKIGFPRDKFYSLGVFTYSQKIEERIKEYKKVLNKHNYTNDSLYIYSFDEADEKRLKVEKERIEIAKNIGVKVFVAGYDYTYKHIGDRLDLLIYAGGAIDRDAKRQVENWHQSKHEIFAYASPQVGVENPEIYRRNFGCKLWKENFDGAMDYAYQKQYGDFWNDFDSNPRAIPYREEAFSYPTSNGIIGTVQWEGYRAAITDVQYISTLENLRDRLKDKGVDTSELDVWINSIDCNSDLNQLQEKIIDKILYHLKE